MDAIEALHSRLADSHPVHDSGILVRVEPNRDAHLARITVRTTNDVVSAEVLRLICQPLNKDTTLS
jgi:hypothetical protein